MKRLLERSFVVDAPPETAWQTLIDAAHWPSWAHHLRGVELTPHGDVGPSTMAKLTLINHTSATVGVTDFVPGERFWWEGKFLWLGLAYDHIVEPSDHAMSRITFSVEAGGVGASSVGRLFAAIYARNLDRAIPRLQAQFARSPTEGAMRYA